MSNISSIRFGAQLDRRLHPSNVPASRIALQLTPDEQREFNNLFGPKENPMKRRAEMTNITLHNFGEPDEYISLGGRHAVGGGRYQMAARYWYPTYSVAPLEAAAFALKMLECVPEPILPNKEKYKRQFQDLISTEESYKRIPQQVLSLIPSELRESLAAVSLKISQAMSKANREGATDEEIGAGFREEQHSRREFENLKASIPADTLKVMEMLGSLLPRRVESRY